MQTYEQSGYCFDQVQVQKNVSPMQSILTMWQLQCSLAPWHWVTDAVSDHVANCREPALPVLRFSSAFWLVY